MRPGSITRRKEVRRRVTWSSLLLLSSLGFVSHTPSNLLFLVSEGSRRILLHSQTPGKVYVKEKKNHVVARTRDHRSHQTFIDDVPTYLLESLGDESSLREGGRISSTSRWLDTVRPPV